MDPILINETTLQSLSSGDLTALFVILAGILVFAIVVGLFVYLFTAFAWMSIAKKLKYKRPWLAWIPFASSAMVLQLGGFHWAWIFLLLIPVFGWVAFAVLAIMARWRIFEKRSYPGWLSLVPLLALIPYLGWLGFVGYFVVLGFVAWNDVKKKKR